MNEQEQRLAALMQRDDVVVQAWHTDLLDTAYGEPRAVKHTITITEPGDADRFGLTTMLNPIDWHHAPEEDR